MEEDWRQKTRWKCWNISIYLDPCMFTSWHARLFIYSKKSAPRGGAGSGYEVNTPGPSSQLGASSSHCDRYQDAAAASQMLDIINDDYNVTVMLLTMFHFLNKLMPRPVTSLLMLISKRGKLTKYLLVSFAAAAAQHSPELWQLPLDPGTGRYWPLHPGKICR